MCCVYWFRLKEYSRNSEVKDIYAASIQLFKYYMEGPISVRRSLISDKKWITMTNNYIKSVRLDIKSLTKKNIIKVSPFYSRTSATVVYASKQHVVTLLDHYYSLSNITWCNFSNTTKQTMKVGFIRSVLLLDCWTYGIGAALHTAVLYFYSKYSSAGQRLKCMAHCDEKKKVGGKEEM